MIVPNVTNEDFLMAGYIPIDISELQGLGAIKTLSFQDYSGQRNQSIGIYDDFLILPKVLYEHQNILRITENVSSKVNAEIRYAITNNLEDYYVFVSGEFVRVSEVRTGMSKEMLEEVDLTDWKGGIGIAVSIQEKSVDKPLSVKDLFISLNTDIEIMANGRYKVSYGTLVDTEVGDISIIDNEEVDEIFS